MLTVGKQSVRYSIVNKQLRNGYTVKITRRLPQTSPVDFNPAPQQRATMAEKSFIWESIGSSLCNDRDILLLLEDPGSSALA